MDKNALVISKRLEERFPFVMEKAVVLVRQQMEQSFPLEIFRKKKISSDVVLFSRFYRNDRNITEPFASVTLVSPLNVITTLNVTHINADSLLLRKQLMQRNIFKMK